ncbi:Bromodomain associated domain [Dillenia turbinata]|uniref:Transcription initiation factor TFIID subunit 8 n=1 Tax=Dillenia turbinata TaxID=194707 RepID=A0AAN8YS65_9MAGN
MSNGGGESGKKECEQRTKGRFGGGEEFGRAIAKISVAQICENAGFQSFQSSALETLADIAIRYIRNLGQNANYYANLAGRAESNVVDVFQGLEDLGLSQGFLGLSDVNRCPIGSGLVREISQNVNLEEEVPFLFNVPRFPVVKETKLAPNFLQVGENSPNGHIPHWLPKFPDPHLYVSSPVWNPRPLGVPVDKTDLTKEQKKVEWPLMNLQHQFACNGSAPPLFVDPGDATTTKGAAQSNPFLSAPLRFGEKEVTPLFHPAKLESHARNHVLEEKVAPVIDKAKSALDSEDSRNKIVLNSRPSVQFKLGISKKLLTSAMGLSSQRKSVEKTACWFESDDKKDEKKRKKEQILKGPMDKPQELDHL